MQFGGYHLSGFEATLTIHELEQILAAEDAHKQPRGKLLWAVDVAAWACQEEGVKPGTTPAFMQAVEVVLRKDGGDDEDADSLAQLALAMSMDASLGNLVATVCQRPADDPNPDHPDPAASSQDDVEIPSVMPPWAARWFEVASDELGMSSSDLVSASMTLLVRLRADKEGEQIDVFDGVRKTLKQVDTLHSRAAKTRNPDQAERLLKEAEALLEKATEEIEVRGAHGDLVHKAIGMFKFDHWQGACLAFADGAVKAERTR